MAHTLAPASVRPPGPARRRSGDRYRRARLAAFGIVPLLLLAAALSAVAHPLPSSASGFTSYATGPVDVVFPSPLPGVELLDHANHSIGVALIVANIVELQPGASDHPIVVQVATPTGGSPFQPTSSGGQNSFKLNLHGTLPVIPVHEPLWTTPLGLPPVNQSGPAAPIGLQSATLVVSYTELAPPSKGATGSGLDLSWSIRNWPWLAGGDLLGVEVQFEVFNATGFRACPAPVAVNNATAAECSGSLLSLGSILWNVTGVRSVVGQAHDGLTAAFAWGGTESATGIGSAPVTAGTYFSTPGVDRLTLVGPARGANNVTTAAHLALNLPPVPPAVAQLLHANPWAFGGAVVLFATLSVGGVVVYRRRDRRIRDEL